MNISKIDYERRLKVLNVSADEILSLLKWKQDDYIVLKSMPHIPVDAVVKAVQWSIVRQCWQIVLASNEFPQTAAGEELVPLDFINQLSSIYFIEKTPSTDKSHGVISPVESPVT